MTDPLANARAALADPNTPQHLRETFVGDILRAYVAQPSSQFPSGMDRYGIRRAIRVLEIEERKAHNKHEAAALRRVAGALKEAISDESPVL